MVKFYESNFDYNYPFPAVTLAYFLRYPNPYSTHVLSTDVIDRRFDSETQRLTTTRLHLKRSKLPPAILKLLPRSLLGASAAGDSQAYILEKSIVDVKEGWMETESRNLEWTGVLSVIEKQVYRRPADLINSNIGGRALVNKGLLEDAHNERTDVTTYVTLQSRLGEKIWKRRTKNGGSSPTSSSSDDEAPAKVGFFKSWTASSMQRSIELIGLRRAEGSQPKAKEGMTIVLERLRQGGLTCVLDGMRRDREAAFGPQSPFKRAFGGRSENELNIRED
ncbi:hypothetical protein B0A49_08923 [Cryomyces minteri]|uniref:PRELI/MSF1 domain-containing protein n=1 Tax=Cryomyces minteri TaxID=331657 RepID=A0A4U0WDG8_9PEZI|nr:hypothetical protein B0A49_08923 [Cryomyces minteri]